MASWEPLMEGVTWKSPPLLGLRVSRAEIEQRLGPPHVVDADSNGMGPFDAWAIRFPCGLEICVWIFHWRSDGSAIDDPEEPARTEVYASPLEEKHILFHLPFPARDVSRWQPPSPEP